MHGRDQLFEGNVVTFYSVVFPLATDVHDPLSWPLKPVHFAYHKGIAMRLISGDRTRLVKPCILAGLFKKGPRCFGISARR